MRVRFRDRRRAAARSPRSRAAWSPGVISRVKIMGDLDIAERRLPQDGRVGADGRGPPGRRPHRHAAVRARRGRRHAHPRQGAGAASTLDTLGMRRGARSASRPAFSQAYGAVLVTGPTGSGKSTTLYAALNAINTVEKNIITIEDPVEYQLPGINQIQVNLQGGAHLRQRPALDAARGPGHHHGRRDPRRRDGADRDRVGAHRPPRALDAAHQRRAVGDHAPDRDGHRAVPERLRRRLRRRPAARAQAVHATASGAPCSSVRALEVAGLPRRRSTSRPTRRSAAPAATTPATGAGSACTRSCCDSDEIRALTIERSSADEIRTSRDRAGHAPLRDDGLEKVRHGITSIAEVRGSPDPGELPIRKGTDGFRFRRHADQGHGARCLRPPHHRRRAADGAPARPAQPARLPEAHPAGHARDRLLDPHRTTSASGSRTTGRSTSRTRSPAGPASASTPSSSARRSAPRSA